MGWILYTFQYEIIESQKNRRMSHCLCGGEINQNNIKIV